MLDQNTDRLWYVIGAVIVGAVIIFNAKGAFAEMFASVGESVGEVLSTVNYSDEDKGAVTYEEWVEDLENQGYVVAEDSDFTWVAVSWAPNLYDHDDNDTTPNAKGYFKYTGKDKQHVIVPETVNGNVLKDAYYMFRNSNVQGVAMNNESVTNMCYMFNDSKATSLDLSSFDTSNVTDMQGMFAGSQATSLDLSSFDTSKVTSMYNMFDDSKATSLDLSSFNTSNVTDMQYMFRSSQATSLDLSSFDTSNVTSMHEMFYYSKATSLDLSSFDTSKVTDMGEMFSGSQATSLDLSSFDTSKVTNMYQMFYYSKATSLDLSSFDTSKVTDMRYMFYSSEATTGHARTQTDADKLNNSLRKPSGLTFTVKP